MSPYSWVKSISGVDSFVFVIFILSFNFETDRVTLNTPDMSQMAAIQTPGITLRFFVVLVESRT